MQKQRCSEVKPKGPRKADGLICHTVRLVDAYWELGDDVMRDSVISTIQEQDHSEGLYTHLVWAKVREGKSFLPYVHDGCLCEYFGRNSCVIQVIIYPIICVPQIFSQTYTENESFIGEKEKIITVREQVEVMRKCLVASSGGRPKMKRIDLQQKILIKTIVGEETGQKAVDLIRNEFFAGLPKTSHQSYADRENDPSGIGVILVGWIGFVKANYDLSLTYQTRVSKMEGQALFQLVQLCKQLSDKQQVQLNSLMRGGLAHDEVQRLVEHGRNVFRHREYVQPMIVSNGYQLVFRLNPGAVGTFPLMSRRLNRLQYYQFSGLVFEYVPRPNTVANGLIGSMSLPTQRKIHKSIKEVQFYRTNQYGLTAVECRKPDEEIDFLIAHQEAKEEFGYYTMCFSSLPWGNHYVGDLWVSYEVQLYGYMSFGPKVTKNQRRAKNIDRVQLSVDANRLKLHERFGGVKGFARAMALKEIEDLVQNNDQYAIHSCSDVLLQNQVREEVKLLLFENKPLESLVECSQLYRVDLGGGQEEDQGLILDELIDEPLSRLFGDGDEFEANEFIDPAYEEEE